MRDITAVPDTNDNHARNPGSDIQITSTPHVIRVSPDHKEIRSVQEAGGTGAWGAIEGIHYVRNINKKKMVGSAAPLSVP